MHDFVVEMTMRLNGVPLPSSGRWTFGEKTVFGQSVPARLPPPLDAAATVYWPRTARLYTVGEVAYNGAPLILRRPKIRSCSPTGTTFH
jgi:hypothetical protein